MLIVTRRRALKSGFAAALAGAAATAVAQVAGRSYRLGILRPTPPYPESVVTALREFGYEETRNLVVERRYANGLTEQLPKLARELVQLKMDAILAVGTSATRALIAETTTLPIVMWANLDPVQNGLVRSLARPGGNVTGVLIAPDGSLAGKKLELLKLAVPQAHRVALLAPDDPALSAQIREVQQAADLLGLELIVVTTPGFDYERAFASVVQKKPDAMFVAATTYFSRDRQKIISLALRYRLPAIYEWREQVVDGGLMAYATSQPALIRRLAEYIDRIFDGANPADMPIDQPTKFELVVNARTARAIGLTLPPSLVARADEVIE